MRRVLLVDDDPVITKYLTRVLENEGYDVRAVRESLRAMRAATQFRPDAIVLDLALPGKSGLDLLPELRAACPRAPVIIYTGAGDVEGAVEAMKLGAYDFIQKPLNYDALLLSLQRAFEVSHLRDENAFLRHTYRARFGPAAILVFSDAMRAVLALADRYRALPTVPVLIEGESGTGKDLLAHYIHYDEENLSRPYVAINCGAIPKTLVESELFGYAPGAFTGARAEGAPGKIQAADGGTLFLDEIGEMDTGSQAKLLRFLEHGIFYPVGSHRECSVRTRVICATNRRLADAVAQGEFRRDLYYRINVGHIRVPPLRERREEILPFARHFLAQFGERVGNRFGSVDPAAEPILVHAPWEGNVRELRNAMERVVLMHQGPVLRPEHLAFLAGGSAAARARHPGQGSGPAEAPLPEGGLDLEHTTLRILQRALEKHDFNQSRTARYLNITREALRYRLQKLGPLPRPGTKGHG